MQNIFADAGVEWKWYRYFEPASVGLDFEGLMEDLRGAPEGSVVVLHGDILQHPQPYLKTLAQSPRLKRPLGGPARSARGLRRGAAR